MTGLDDVAALIGRGRRFLCAAHARPDGDALGSMLATAHGLRALGKEVALYDHDLPPERLRFLPGASEVRTTVGANQRFDATFVHDCGDARLLGHRFPPREVTGPIVVLDHHASVKPFGDLVLRDSSASAVGVIVARLLRRLGVAIDRPIAESLWCSLASDTGWFRYSSTDVETMELATACVAAGAQPWKFALESEEAWPPARLRLLARVLGTLELVGDAPPRAAILTLADEMLGETGASPDLADGFVNYARGLAGVEIGVLVSITRREVHVSLRSKGSADVGALAAKLGGGGHRAAAGCTLPLPADAALATLKAALADALKAA
ncbi:MAG TPA: DHH family phosphoesterase [Polyangia bacterium]|nr:DHH family phosphoesterase [Polyangia bacterium]